MSGSVTQINIGEWCSALASVTSKVSTELNNSSVCLVVYHLIKTVLYAILSGFDKYAVILVSDFFIDPRN